MLGDEAPPQAEAHVGPPKADTEVPNYDRTATRLGASAGLARFELLTMAAQPPKKPEGLYGFGYQQTENFCWLSGGERRLSCD